MTHIRTLRLVLPARFAGLGSDAARALAEALVAGAAPEALARAASGGALTLADRGQTPAMLGAEAARGARSRSESLAALAPGGSGRKP